MKKFIYSTLHKLYQLPVNVINRLKSLHQRILTTNADNLPTPSNRNFYQLVWDWLIDVLSFGFIAMLGFVGLIGYPGFVKCLFLILGFGMAKETICEFVKGVTSSWRGSD